MYKIIVLFSEGSPLLWRLAVYAPVCVFELLPVHVALTALHWPAKECEKGPRIMETLIGLPFAVLECPNIKLKKPSWLHMPSAMTVYAVVIVSYFLITGGESIKLVLASCVSLL